MQLLQDLATMKWIPAMYTNLVLHIMITYAIIPSELTIHMNTKVSPCTDFYQYACGNWVKHQKLHPSVTHVELIDPLHGDVEEAIQEIIDEKPPLIGELWDSCMDIDKINVVGNKPLEMDLQRITQAKSRTHLFELMGEFSRTGAQAFLMMDVEKDPTDATTYSLVAYEAALTLPSLKHYSEDTFPRIESAYREYINNLIKLSGYSYSGRSPADVVIEMEQSIRDIQNKVEENNGYHISIKTARKKWPRTCGAFYQGMMMETSSKKWSLFRKKQKMHIKTIMFETSQYFDLIEKLVKTLSIADLKVYIAFVLIHSRVPWLGDDFLTAHFRFFEQTLRGRQESTLRQAFCRARISEYLPQLIGHKYAAKVLDQETETSAMELVKRIQNIMKHRISTLSWLDEPTRNEAQAKLKHVKVLIGQSKIPPRYAFTLSHDDYAVNIYTILMDTFNTKLKKIHTFVNRDEWNISPSEVNAHYIPIENKLIFPAAILQPPMLAGHDHPARNFGAIGTTMGHEITHGFDNIGRHFDATGNLRTWWTTSTATAFNDNAKCFEDLYSSFKMYGKHRYLGNVDGELTLHENIADSGGVSLAWDAYREYMTTVKPNTHDVTQEEGDQMFFIAYAQSFCTKSRDKYIEDMLMMDTHTPSQWRINGVVMNNEDFAKVFKCDVNTPMNPQLKCKIW